MRKELKKCTRFFTLTDYEKEEQWLREMANKGWMLNSVNVWFYTFVRITPKDIVFKLDFQDTREEPEEEYLKMLEDYGWAYLTSVNNYRYLYKEATGDEAENELYSDNASKLDMLQRIVKCKVLPVMCIFLCCVVPGFIRVIEGDYSSNGWNIFWIAMMLVYIFIFVKVGLGYGRLYKKYHER